MKRLKLEAMEARPHHAVLTDHVGYDAMHLVSLRRRRKYEAIRLRGIDPGIRCARSPIQEHPVGRIEAVDLAVARITWAVAAALSVSVAIVTNCT